MKHFIHTDSALCLLFCFAEQGMVAALTLGDDPNREVHGRTWNGRVLGSGFYGCFAGCFCAEIWL